MTITQKLNLRFYASYLKQYYQSGINDNTTIAPD